MATILKIVWMKLNKKDNLKVKNKLLRKFEQFEFLSKMVLELVQEDFSIIAISFEHKCLICVFFKIFIVDLQIK